jgi:hypothetical protein
MVLNLKKGVVHLRCLNDEVIDNQLEGWSGTINENMLAGATWSSDSRQVLTFMDL